MRRMLNSQKLIPAEEIVEICRHVRARPILCADELPRDFSLAIDDVCFGVYERTVICGNLHRRVAVSGEINPIGLQELGVGLGVGVNADSEDHAAFRLDFPLKRDKRGCFVDTRGAPGCPEVKHNHFATKIGELRWPPVQLNREWLCCGSSRARFAILVAGSREYNQQARHSSQRDPAQNLSFHAYLLPRTYATNDIFFVGV